MGLQRTQAVVIGRRPLGEADRLVTFYTREFGRLTGVAKGARRPRSRFGSALELFSQGQLLFFETERSALVKVDHFDLLHPFLGVREELDRLGHGAWVLECLARLTAERDPHAALYGLLVRTLRALEEIPWPPRAVLGFALRAVDLLGHRLRLDRCLGCGKVPGAVARLDFAAGGLFCEVCAHRAPDSLPFSAPAVGSLRRLRTLRWEELLATRLARPVEGEIAAALEAHVVRLLGQPLRTSRFLAQTRRTLVSRGGPR
ncbi:MAG: DNA repair protein RecO [Candidatus Rokubacteria bacterium]|nr:DNA repair protein RecO [Candidatus Rokubacteria bacterium]